MTAPFGPFLVESVQRHDDGVCTVTLTGDLEAVRSAGARLQEQIWIVTSDPAADERERIKAALDAIQRDAAPLMIEGTEATRVVAKVIGKMRRAVEGGA